MGGGPMMMHAGFRSLAVAVPLADGGWLNFVTALPEAGAAPSRQLLISMALMAIIILGVSIWAVRRVTAPLVLAFRGGRAARSDLNAPPMAETGSDRDATSVARLQHHADEAARTDREPHAPARSDFA